jgi:hypothetical protein
VAGLPLEKLIFSPLRGLKDTRKAHFFSAARAERHSKSSFFSAAQAEKLNFSPLHGLKAIEKVSNSVRCAG